MSKHKPFVKQYKNMLQSKIFRKDLNYVSMVVFQHFLVVYGFLNDACILHS